MGEPVQQPDVPPEEDLHPAEKKSQEDAILARAAAIKRKRSAQGDSNTETEMPARVRVASQWDFVLREARWLCIDMLQERIWKKKMAFVIAHEAVNSAIKLRPVPKHDTRAIEDVDPQPCSQRRATRDNSDGPESSNGCTRGKGVKAEDGERDSTTTSAPIVTLLDNTNPALRTWIQTCDLSYPFSKAWANTVYASLTSLYENRVVQHKLQLMAYEEEYEAAAAEVHEGWREAANKDAAMVAVTTMSPIDEPPSRKGRRGRHDASDVNGDDPSAADMHRMRHMRRRMDEPPLQVLPGRMHGTPFGVDQMGVPQGFNSEDDRLLCCLMTEFSENTALVADVYVSTRRLEGYFCDARLTEQRVRDIAQQQAMCPLSKTEAREFLQQSIPCMASVVRRYQATIAPIAHRFVEELVQEKRTALLKRSEMAVQPASARLRDASHQQYIDNALAGLGGHTPDPRDIARIHPPAGMAAAAHHSAGHRGGPGGPGAPGGPSATSSRPMPPSHGAPPAQHRAMGDPAQGASLEAPSTTGMSHSALLPRASSGVSTAVGGGSDVASLGGSQAVASNQSPHASGNVAGMPGEAAPPGMHSAQVRNHHGAHPPNAANGMQPGRYPQQRMYMKGVNNGGAPMEGSQGRLPHMGSGGTQQPPSLPLQSNGIRD